MKWSESAEQGAATTFYLLDPDAIKPGDILLPRAPYAKSKTIRTVTKTKFSHAALCIDYGHFIEAIGSGVCRFAIPAVGVRDRNNVRLLRLKRSIPNADAISKAAAEAGHQNLLRGFSTAGAISVVVPTPIKPDQARIFCSQLVAEAYASVEDFALVPGRLPKKIAPGYLLRSPHLEDVTDQALRSPICLEEPRWCLDDPWPEKRPHEWEAATKLKMLRTKRVRMAVKKLGARPRSFFELESLLRDTKDHDLDRAIVAALEKASFCDTYYAMALKSLDKVNAYKTSMELVKMAADGRLNNAQLAATIKETRQAVRMFEDDLKDRTEQQKLYAKRAKESDLKTFALLGKLQRQLMSLSLEIVTLLKGQLHALEKVAAERRGVF